MVWVVVVIAGIAILILVWPAPSAPTSGCAYPANRPATPASGGYPNAPGFKGEWETNPPSLRVGGHYDFVWRAYWMDVAGNKNYSRANGRVQVFRLEGSAHVQIENIRSNGLVANDTRSAYGCCDAEGRLTLGLYVDLGVPSGGETGRLWGIDPPVNTGGDSHGQPADFEVVPIN